MRLLDTIAAVSTPYGKGGVALIRISGADAVSIAERIFFPANKKKLSDQPCGKMTYGHIFMPQNGGSQSSIDDGMAAVFYAPHSFTGEDTVEITCHGGILITKKVLSAVLCAGARAAEAGEFTRRAYISGKMKLTEAEALGNLLDARSESQLVLARSGMRGNLSDKMGELYETLMRILSGIYAVIDFPDEDLSEISREEMEHELSRVNSEIARLLSTYGTGKAVAEGIPTVICGRTNAGKSSVYNKILGYDAAIVTDIEGTTRDVLRETAIMGGVTLLLCDTAGLRATDDKVESIGIERSLREIEGAGLILAVFDGTKELTEDDIELAKKVGMLATPSIALVNKSDICASHCCDLLKNHFEHTICISALTGDGFDTLALKIEQMFIDGHIDLENDAVVSGARQYAAINNAKEYLETALSDMKAGVSLDACCIAVEAAMSSLGEVDGREISEDIVSDIFSRFCVGK